MSLLADVRFWQNVKTRSWKTKKVKAEKTLQRENKKVSPRARSFRMKAKKKKKKKCKTTTRANVEECPKTLRSA